MRHPNLKLTVPKPREDFAGVQFARLLEPAADVNTDAELYAAVAAHGKAVIIPYNGVMWDRLPIETLTPGDFERTWRGD